MHRFGSVAACFLRHPVATRLEKINEDGAKFRLLNDTAESPSGPQH